GVALREAADVADESRELRAHVADQPCGDRRMLGDGALDARRGQRDAAEATLRRAVAAHPHEAEAHYALALTLAQQGRVVDALGPLSQASRLRPEEPRYAYVQGIALNQLRRTEEAVAILRANLERHPRHRDSLFALATIERDRANITEAEQLAAAAVALNPADREAAALLAQLRDLRQRLPTRP
ncbi:MAG: tetratricopeptide repeat protein, partial [Rhodobacter sp.]|nr:tetratricopeptide repeat protein [Rhodobacter sp.]